MKYVLWFNHQLPIPYLREELKIKDVTNAPIIIREDGIALLIDKHNLRVIDYGLPYKDYVKEGHSEYEEEAQDNEICRMA